MATSEHSRPLLTIPEAAERLNLSTSTVRRRICAGEIPAVHLGSGPQAPVRIDQAELQEWLASSHVTPAERRVPEGGVVDGAAAAGTGER